MILELKDFLKKHYNIDGNIVLYRDPYHKKKGLCTYLAQQLKDEIGDKEIVTNSVGAFAIYLAKAFPNNHVYTLCHAISLDHADLVNSIPNLSVIIVNKFSHKMKVADNQYFLAQMQEPLIVEYYSKHWEEIFDTLKKNNIQIDAVVDHGHSCGTLAGACKTIQELNLPIKPVLGTFHYSLGRSHIQPYITDILQYPTGNFDSFEVERKLTTDFPDFGNIFESSWSITAAMGYLQDNPGATVVVYVGDAIVRGGL